MAEATNKVHKIEIDPATEMSNYTSYYHDLTFAAAALDRLARMMAANKKDDTLVRALFSSAMVAYSRCFTSRNVGRRMETDFMTENMLKNHDMLRKFRDKHIAHSENPFEQNVVGVVLENGIPVSIQPFNMMVIAPSNHHEIAMVTAFVEQVRDYVGKRSEALSKELLELAKNTDPAILQSFPELSMIAPGVDDLGKKRRL